MDDNDNDNDDANDDDSDLLTRIRNGDDAAWRTLVRRYGDLVNTVPRRARLPQSAVEDVFQNTWMRLVEHLDGIRDPSSIRQWLVTTAKRETLRWLDTQGRVGGEPDGGLDPPDPGLGPEGILALIDDMRRIHAAVRRLGTRCREIVTAVYLRDPPEAHAQLAGRLGVAENSISPLRLRCLAQLKGLLSEGDAVRSRDHGALCRNPDHKGDGHDDRP